MSDSQTIKTEAMCWLRYGKRMPLVVTEVGRWNADVLGLSDTMAIEVEVKISKQDLLREFKDKKTKHWYYDHAKGPNESIPNFFYFAVPEALEKVAAEILADKAPKAGLVVRTDTDLLAGRNMRVARRPVRLRDGAPSPRLLQTALARMSSELCGSKLIIDQLRLELSSRFDDIVKGTIACAARIAGTLDIEQDLDLDQRAAELAFCVEARLWSEVEDKDRWREAARKWLDCQFLHNREWTADAFRSKG